MIRFLLNVVDIGRGSRFQRAPFYVDSFEDTMPRPRLATEADYYRLPAPPPVTIQPGSFALCPVVNLPMNPAQLSGMTDLYRLALEQAAAAARDSHPASSLFGLWN